MAATDMKEPVDGCLIMHCLNILMLKKKICVSLTPILKTEKKDVQKWRSLSKIMVVLTACFWVWEYGHLALNEPGYDIHIRAHSCSLAEVHKDSTVSDLTVIIMAGLLIQIFVYRFNSNLFMALLMFAFVILDIAKQGICKDGAIICFRGRQFYRWEEADIRVIDSEELLIIINDSIKFKFNKNKRDRIIKILSENRLYFPASQE